MTVLQTIALPLGYSAIRMARGRVIRPDGAGCQHLDLDLSRGDGADSGISAPQNGPNRRSMIHQLRFAPARRFL